MSKDSNDQRFLLPASDVLQSLLGNGKSPLAQGFTRWKLWRNWPQVVGETVARHSQPVGYDRGTLVVWVDSSPRMHEMTFLAGTLIQKINKFIGRKWVNYIRFTLDDREVPKLQESDDSFKNFLTK